MIKFYLLQCIIFFSNIVYAQNVGIGTATPDASAQLDISSNNKGLLPPRLTIAQRNSIVNPAEGLIIYNTSTGNLEILGNTGWNSLSLNKPALKNLYGGSGNEIVKQLLFTTDRGYLCVGYSTSSNSGSLSGLTNFGVNDGWVMKLDNYGNIQWQKLFGGTGSFDQFFSACLTNDGGYLLAGTCASSNSGTLTGISSNGSQDGWIVKLDAAGNTVWQKLLGGSGNDSFQAVVQTTDNGFLLAGYSYSSNSGTLTGYNNYGASDGWLLRIDLNGNMAWQKLLGGSVTDVFYSVLLTADAGFITAGSSNSASGTGTLTGLINNGGQDGWILKGDAAGNTQWQKLYGGSASDVINAVQTITGTEYYLAGTSSSSNTGTMPDINNNGLQDGWMMKTDINGDMIWQKLLGGSDNETISKLYPLIDGSIMITGNAASTMSGTLAANAGFGNADAWLINMDASGNTRWQKLLGGTNADAVECMLQMQDGSFILGVNSSSPNSGMLTGLSGYGGSDCWLLRADIYGNPY